MIASTSHANRGRSIVDKGKFLTSGQMAKASRVSEKALRVYQEKGILVPQHVDAETGRRYYDIQQSVKLDMVLQLQLMGFSLNEIAAINERGDMAYLRECAQQRLDAIEAQQHELAVARALTEELAHGCDAYLDQPILNQIMLEMLPERRILPFKVANPAKLRAGEASSNAEQWEWALRATRQQIADQGLPLSLFQNSGTLIPRAGLIAGVPTKEYIFGWVHEDLDDPLAGTQTLPGGEYLVLYLDQAYDKHGQELDSERLVRMVEYAGKKRMAVAGDAFGEILCRYPRFFDMGSRLLYRLCIPVRPDHKAARQPSTHTAEKPPPTRGFSAVMF